MFEANFDFIFQAMRSDVRELDATSHDMGDVTKVVNQKPLANSRVPTQCLIDCLLRLMCGLLLSKPEPAGQVLFCGAIVPKRVPLQCRYGGRIVSN